MPMTRNHSFPPLLSLAQLDDAVETLSSAFFQDPVWQFIYPDGRKRQRGLKDFFRAFLALRITQHKAYGIGAPPVGVAVWDIPGLQRVSLSLLVLLLFVKLAFSPFPLPVSRRSRS